MYEVYWQLRRRTTVLLCLCAAFANGSMAMFEACLALARKFFQQQGELTWVIICFSIGQFESVKIERGVAAVSSVR